MNDKRRAMSSLAYYFDRLYREVGLNFGEDNWAEVVGVVEDTIDASVKESKIVVEHMLADFREELAPVLAVSRKLEEERKEREEWECLSKKYGGKV